MCVRLRQLMMVPVVTGIVTLPAFSEDRAAGLPAASIEAPAGVVVAPPVSVVPSQTGFAATTSLSALSDYNARLLASKTEQLTAPGLMRLPRPPNVSLPIDVWTRVQVDGVGTAAASQSTNVVAGVKYRLGRSSSLGVSTPLSPPTDHAAAFAATDAEPLTAFAHLHVTSGLTVRAEGKRHVRAPEVMGDARQDQDEISIAPRISPTIDLPHGQQLQPFVELKNVFDAESGTEGVSSAGAGFVLNAPGSYSFSLSTSVNQSDAGDSRSAAEGRMELKIPMP